MGGGSSVGLGAHLSLPELALVSEQRSLGKDSHDGGGGVREEAPLLSDVPLHGATIGDGCWGTDNNYLGLIMFQTTTF